MTITVNPMNWPRVILRGVIVWLMDASEKKVTKGNMSSMSVIVNDVHAIAIDFPNCITREVGWDSGDKERRGTATRADSSKRLLLHKSFNKGFTVLTISNQTASS